MDFSILQSPDEVIEFLSMVVDSADQHRDELGFLPPTAYEAQAQKGRLWVVVNHERKYIGHLMFGGSKQALKITQMFVEEPCRGSGVATKMLSALKEDARKRGSQYIQARVAADLKANKFWEQNGFAIASQVAGGETTRRIINIRVWFVPNSGLFETSTASEQPISSKPAVLSKLLSYVLDTNVIIDFARRRGDYADIENIIEQSIGNQLRLRSSPKLQDELAKGDSAGSDDVAVRLAKLISPLARIPAVSESKYVEDLFPLVFPHRQLASELKPNERSDLVHLAYCIEYKQDGFVTRDGPILRAANKISAKYQIEVLTPYDLAPAEGSPQDKSYGDISFSWASFADAKQIIKMSFPEHLIARINSISADWLSRDDQNQRLLCVSTNQNRVGAAFIIWNSSEASWEVIMAAEKSVSVARDLIDFVLQHIYEICRENHCATICITLPANSVEIYEQAVKNGFVVCEIPERSQSTLQLKRIVFKGRITQTIWPDIISYMRRFLGWKLNERMPKYDEFVNTGVEVYLGNGTAKKTYFKLIQFENLVAPGIVFQTGRPAALIPIQGRFARQLLPETEPTEDMLARMYAGMYTDRAYFSHAPSALPITVGGIVVFYESGKRGEAVAIARVTSLAEMTEREAKASYVSRGVMELGESDGLVKVLTFSSMQALVNPVPFQWMRRNGIITGANLVTAQRIDTEQLENIVSYRPS